MTTRLAVLGAVVLFAVSGCSARQEATAVPVVSLPPAPEITVQPAASAGGACILWDYDLIEQAIGIRFAVAASDQVDATSSCVVQTVTAAWPDLSLAVAETTTASAEVFLDERMPANATKLKGLGRAAYRRSAKAAGEHGPTVEVAWLSEAKQLRTLRFTFAKGATPAQVKDMNAKLPRLAQALGATNSAAPTKGAAPTNSAAPTNRAAPTNSAAVTNR